MKSVRQNQLPYPTFPLFTFPPFLESSDIYFYRIAAIDESRNESNFTEEFEVSTVPSLSDPLSFKVELLNKRVRPLLVRLSWNIDSTKVRPDRFIIEKKIDVLNDVFQVVGEAFIENEFLDKDIESGNNYIYRIKGVDLLGRESQVFEARLST